MRKREREGNQEGNTQQQQQEERKRRGAERGNARVSASQTNLMGPSNTRTEREK